MVSTVYERSDGTLTFLTLQSGQKFESERFNHRKDSESWSLNSLHNDRHQLHTFKHFRNKYIHEINEYI